MNDKAKAQIKRLNQQILAAQDAYYDGKPTISDGEYDALENQLRSLVNQNPQFSPIATVLSNVGNTSNSISAIQHAKPMLSIENYYTEETFVDAAKNYGSVLLIEPKLDGNSCELTYENGVLVRAVTRGDGKNGENITAQVMSLKRLPKKINTNISDLRIRGEMVMSNTELARINSVESKNYANTRNLVAGTLKQKDLNIVAGRDIVLIPWDMYSPTQDDLLSDSAYDRMKLAFSFGFPHTEGMKIKSSDILSELVLILKQNESSDINADGVVLKADSHKLRNKLGVSSKYTNYQHCFKPQNLAAETTLLGIEYGLGRTGKVTPVALLQPVNLGGAMVARASVCNETYMDALGLKIGAKVKVLRSGDVIPYITEVVNSKGCKDIVFPRNCPSCNSKLVIRTTDSDVIEKMCDNSKCPGKAAEQFAYIANRETLEIDNLGDSMAAEIVERKDALDIAQLFVLGNTINGWLSVASDSKVAEDLKDSGFRSGVNVIKMARSLEKAKSATWDRWIASLNIPMIGHSLGKDISKALNLTSDDMKNLPKLFLTLPSLNLEKLGTAKTNAIVEWSKIKANVDLCKTLYAEGVRPTPLAAPKQVAGAKLNGIAFCITGTLSMGSRTEVEEKLVALGAEALSDVRSNCNLVIVGDAPGSKLAKAQKKGIKIVDDAWVRKTLGI